MKINMSDLPKIESWHFVTYGAAIFQAYHTGRAFYVYDPDGWHIGSVNIGGLILGGIVNLIVARAANKLPSIAGTFSSLKALLPKEAKKADKKGLLARARALKKMSVAAKQNTYAQFGFYALLALSALMVAPALFILWSKTIPFAPIVIGLLAGIGAVAPDVAIAVGGFVSGEEVPSHSVSTSKGPTESDGGSTETPKSASRSPKKSEEPAAQMRACDLGCGMSYRWPQGKGAHMKKYHPELCIVKGTPAAVALPIKK